MDCANEREEVLLGRARARTVVTCREMLINSLGGVASLMRLNVISAIGKMPIHCGSPLDNRALGLHCNGKFLGLFECGFLHGDGLNPELSEHSCKAIW